MTGPITLETLLQIEDSDELAALCCPSTGILLWPALRNQFLRAIISSFFYANEINTSHDIGILKSQRLRSFCNYVAHNIAHGGDARGDICLMLSGRGLAEVNGLWVNPFNDALYDAMPARSFLFEDHFAWHYPAPRRSTKVRYHTPYQAVAALRGRFAGKNELRLADAVLDIVVARARTHLDWSISADQHARFRYFLASKIAAMPMMFDIYRRLLKRSGVRLLIKEEACYGPSAVVISAARSLGIRTAEYQHGAITRGHDSYNVAPAMHRSIHYRNTLPDSLLFFGAWWADQVDLPLQKLVIGSPVKTPAPDTLETRNRETVLVLGDGIDTITYLRFSQHLAIALAPAGLRVLFRPHPLERAALKHLRADEAVNIDIDSSPDIYVSLSGARAVIGEASTGLFEAMGLAERVFVWHTDKAQFKLPVHPFETFKDQDDLAAQLSSPPAKRQSIPAQAIWADGWLTNYQAFLKRELSRPVL